MNSTEANDEYWMQFAYEQAALAASEDEIPVGAVIVSQGKVIGAGYNAPIKLSDPTAHAEIQALRSACQAIDNYRLPDDATLYVTLEPCTMCAGAISNARIARVIYGAKDEKTGAIDSGVRFFDSPSCHHRPEIISGILSEECGENLKNFFKSKRN